jgi:hypothetical protein
MGSISGQHLRLTLETDGRQSNVRQEKIIDEGLIPPTRVVGPLVYQVFVDGRLVMTDTLPDPLVERGVARSNERDHFFRTVDKGTFIVRVPLPENRTLKELEIKIFRVTTKLPEIIDELEYALQVKSRPGVETLGIIDLPLLIKHPDWKDITDIPVSKG